MKRQEMTIDDLRRRAESGDFDAMRELAAELRLDRSVFCLSPECEAWLWIAENKKRPLLVEEDEYEGVRIYESWGWWNADHCGSYRDVPGPVFEKLEGMWIPLSEDGWEHAWFDSRDQAYRALVAAYCTARREGWMP